MEMGMATITITTMKDVDAVTRGDPAVGQGWVMERVSLLVYRLACRVLLAIHAPYDCGGSLVRCILHVGLLCRDAHGHDKFEVVRFASWICDFGGTVLKCGRMQYCLSAY